MEENRIKFDYFFFSAQTPQQELKSSRRALLSSGYSIGIIGFDYGIAPIVIHLTVNAVVMLWLWPWFCLWLGLRMSTRTRMSTRMAAAARREFMNS